MLVLYFSGTGNTKYIAERFSRKMDAVCLSIEDDADFTTLIGTHDTVVFCYPVYGSRVPRIMREFAAEHTAALKGKKLVVFITQVSFSGDGARVLCDLLPEGHVEVIYAEHFNMPNNICNFVLLRKASKKSIQNRLKKAEKLMDEVCRNINAGIVKKKGFSNIAKLLGMIQGRAWQGDSRNIAPKENTMEYRAQRSIRIDSGCTVCEVCVEVCPMKNLENSNGAIIHKNNCTICYRCVNRCPQREITIFFHTKPKWQYEGLK